MAFNSMYQVAQQVHLTLFPQTYFNLVIADVSVRVKLSPP